MHMSTVKKSGNNSKKCKFLSIQSIRTRIGGIIEIPNSGPYHIKGQEVPAGRMSYRYTVNLQ